MYIVAILAFVIMLHPVIATGTKSVTGLENKIIYKDMPEHVLIAACDDYYNCAVWYDLDKDCKEEYIIYYGNEGWYNVLDKEMEKIYFDEIIKAYHDPDEIIQIYFDSKCFTIEDVERMIKL
jgi:hypothetical protein